MKKNLVYILLSLFTLVTFFVNRNALPTDIMEVRNMVTAREMVTDGHWLVPTMNGELRLEKPPLPTWVAGVIEKLVPGSLAAQRAAAGVMGTMWVFFLFLTVKYVTRRQDLALATALVFLTCYNVILMGRSSTWDIYCHAFMMGGIYFLTRGLREESHTGVWLGLAGAMMGLSFLSKGPVSFYALLLPYLFTFIPRPRPSMKGKFLPLAGMCLIALIIGGWWYAWLQMAHPEAVAAVVGKESAAWLDHNVRPWYYYWRFFTEMGAWAVLMAVALIYPYWKKHISVPEVYRTAMLWALGSLVLLSLMPEKKMRYLLPLFAPCAMVVGCLLVHFKERVRAEKASRLLFQVNGTLLSVIVLALPVGTYLFGVRNGGIGLPLFILTTLFLIAAAAWLLRSTLKLHPMQFVGGIAVVFVMAECFLLPTIGSIFGNPEAYSIAHVQSDARVKNVPFYYVKGEELRIELVYAARRKILPLDLNDSMAVKRALPCALVSRRWAGQTLTAQQLERIDTVAIGTYDDNSLPKNNRHYNDVLLSHVTLLTKSHKTNR